MSYSWCDNGCTGAGCSRRLSIASFILILVGILVAFIAEQLSISFVLHHVGSASCPRGNHSLLVPRSWATSVFIANLHAVWQLPHSRQHELGFHPLAWLVNLIDVLNCASMAFAPKSSDCNFSVTVSVLRMFSPSNFTFISVVRWSADDVDGNLGTTSMSLICLSKLFTNGVGERFLRRQSVCFLVLQLFSH